jgi:2-keto-4-pentenoate hydratase/2-oxohepta-3-ene-1,7-dioic acid hydratase in catechol pathway
MKLLRYGEAGAEKPGLMDESGTIRDLSAHVDDISGAMLDPATLDRLRALDPASLPTVEGRPRIGPCVAGIGKFLCIGLNYSDHAAETGMQAPEHPILFFKASSAVVGPDDDVVLPRGAQKADWEVELGAVIGKPCKYVTPDAALEHVAGYCVVNDVSERHFQMNLSGQWTKGKSCDTFGPTGPWLVTADEVGDPQALSIWMKLNGETMQDGTTANMIFSVAQIVSHLSQLMTLHPGDVISTGTPAGVGMGQKPEPRFLRAGDVMALGIEGLGTQRQTVRDDA